MADNTSNTNTYVPEALAYNNFGIKPVEVTFQLDCKTFTDIVKRIAMEQVSGIEDVTLQSNKDGSVGLFVWFNGDSNHFTDSSTENTALRAKLPRLSNEMKEFIEKFGWRESDDDPRSGNNKVHASKIMIFNDNPEVKGRWVAIHVAINPFLAVMFDIYGNAYKKEFNRNTPKTRVRRDWVWSKGVGSNLTGIRVRKMINNPNLNRDNLHAKWGGKFN